MGITVLLFAFIAYQNDFDFSYKFYFNCKEEICENPYQNIEIKNELIDYYDYKGDCTESWCSQKYLTRGEYGAKPPRWVKCVPFIVILFVVAGLCLNQLIHNKGKKFGVKLNLPDKWINKIKKTWKEREDKE